MVVNGIWWYPSLRNTEWFQNQFIQNRFLQAIAGELNTYLNKLLRQDAQILRDLIHSGADSEAVVSKKQALLQEILTSWLCL